MDISAQILHVVSGTFRWTELQAGLAEKRGPFEWHFPPAGICPVEATEKDVARGIRALATHPRELREWASFILAAAPLISLNRLESSLEGNALLEALWDIAGGAPPETLDLPRLSAIADS